MASPLPIAPQIERVGSAVVRERLDSRVQTNPETGCHEWTGRRDARGYGSLSIGGKWFRAHRLSYALAYSNDPGDLCVCHACDNPRCVNPDHLWLGTVGDNARDMCAKGRKPDHNGELNPRAKLTADQVRAIRVDPRGSRPLARAYGVHQRTIQDIRNGINWSQIL